MYDLERKSPPQSHPSEIYYCLPGVYLPGYFFLYRYQTTLILILLQSVSKYIQLNILYSLLIVWICFFPTSRLSGSAA